MRLVADCLAVTTLRAKSGAKRWLWAAVFGFGMVASCFGASVPTSKPPSTAPALSSSVAEDAAFDATTDSEALADAPTETAEADAPLEGERWTEAHRSVESCEDFRQAQWAEAYKDPHGAKRKFGYDGYVFRRVAVQREIAGKVRLHCVRVYYPQGDKSAAGKTVRISQRIDAAWFRLIENTLTRLPWLHLQTVHAFVIDDRPILHGIASFSREDPKADARDGHTIWLNQRLFTRPNHWGPGNYGKYWAYHVQYDDTRVDGQRDDHDLFSPVLIHEIGHLVNYSIVNGSPADPTCPRCAWMCGDHDNCKDLKQEEKEAYCVTSYCTGFGYSSGTENFAEMYRWFYQGSETRELLAKHFESCFDFLDDERDADGLNGGRGAPWELGLGEVVSYRKTLWDSCGGRACRAY